jgi:hypothetical protein
MTLTRANMFGQPYDLRLLHYFVYVMMLNYFALLPHQSFTLLAPFSAERRRYQGDRHDLLYL